VLKVDAHIEQKQEASSFSFAKYCRNLGCQKNGSDADDVTQQSDEVMEAFGQTLQSRAHLLDEMRQVFLEV
jgi:hypothetical protein